MHVHTSHELSSIISDTYLPGYGGKQGKCSPEREGGRYGGRGRGREEEMERERERETQCACMNLGGKMDLYYCKWITYFPGYGGVLSRRWCLHTSEDPYGGHLGAAFGERHTGRDEKATERNSYHGN